MYVYIYIHIICKYYALYLYILCSLYIFIYIHGYRFSWFLITTLRKYACDPRCTIVKWIKRCKQCRVSVTVKHQGMMDPNQQIGYSGTPHFDLDQSRHRMCVRVCVCVHVLACMFVSTCVSVCVSTLRLPTPAHFSHTDLQLKMQTNYRSLCGPLVFPCWFSAVLNTAKCLILLRLKYQEPRELKRLHVCLPKPSCPHTGCFI